MLYGCCQTSGLLLDKRTSAGRADKAYSIAENMAFMLVVVWTRGFNMLVVG